MASAGPETAHGPSRTLSVERTSFFSKISAHPDVAVELLRHLGARLAWLSERQTEPILWSVEARLARRVLYLAGRSRRGFAVVDMTQSEVAEHLGVSREKVGRVLSNWRAKGWIETKRACIIIRDQAPLLALGTFAT